MNCACELCGNIFDDSSFTVLSVESNEYRLCAKCNEYLDSFNEPGDLASSKKAVNYLYTCYLRCDNNKLANYVLDIIQFNGCEIEHLCATAAVDENNLADYFESRNALKSEDIHGGKKFRLDRVVEVIGVILCILSVLIFIMNLAQSPYGAFILSCQPLFYGLVLIILANVMKSLGGGD